MGHDARFAVRKQSSRGSGAIHLNKCCLISLGFLGVFFSRWDCDFSKVEYEVFIIKTWSCSCSVLHVKFSHMSYDNTLGLVHFFHLNLCVTWFQTQEFIELLEELAGIGIHVLPAGTETIILSSSFQLRVGTLTAGQNHVWRQAILKPTIAA